MVSVEEFRMNPQVKAGVLKRLRDPANKQGRGRLRRDLAIPGDGEGGVCCLELVCQEAIAAGIIPPAEFVAGVGAGTWYYGTRDDNNDCYLPFRVSQWAGLPNNDPFFDFGDLRDRDGDPYRLTWSDLNDGEGMLFPQIADMVDYFF